MKKYLNYLLILVFFISCNKSIENLDSVIQDKKIRNLVDEYIENVLNKNDNKNVYVTGSTSIDLNSIEIDLYNQKPILYTNQDAYYLNSYLESKQFGFFIYKGINFYVTKDLQEIFKLEYKSFGESSNKFDRMDAPENNDPYSMFININKKDSSIAYYSNLSKETLKWKKIK